MGAQTKQEQAPSGTVVNKQHGTSNEVQPAPEKIQISPDVSALPEQALGKPLAARTDLFSLPDKTWPS
jgi:hypothetical protein